MKRIIVGLLAALIGGGILAWGWDTTATIRQSTSWPTTDGIVVQSLVAVDSSRIRGGGYNLTYRVDVRYAYEVDGREFESSTFTFGSRRSFADRARAESEVSAYPVGRGVRVFYDPADPATSALMPGVIPEGFNILMLMSGAFLVAGAASVISGAWSRRGVRKPAGR